MVALFFWLHAFAKIHLLNLPWSQCNVVRCLNLHASAEANILQSRVRLWLCFYKSSEPYSSVAVVFLWLLLESSNMTRCWSLKPCSVGSVQVQIAPKKKKTAKTARPFVEGSSVSTQFTLHQLYRTIRLKKKSSQRQTLPRVNLTFIPAALSLEVGNASSSSCPSANKVNRTPPAASTIAGMSVFCYATSAQVAQMLP